MLACCEVIPQRLFYRNADSVGKMGTMDRELLELFYDARQYDWNSPTIRAIEEGIRLAYDSEERNANSLLINGAKKSRTKMKMTGSHD